jgi:hypothetical protein
MSKHYFEKVSILVKFQAALWWPKLYEKKLQKVKHFWVIFGGFIGFGSG